MAYSDPGDLASGAVITEAWVDAVRADILASAVAIVTTKGDIVAATEANEVSASSPMREMMITATIKSVR